MARVLHFMCPTVKIGEWQTLFDKTLRMKQAGKSEDAVWEHFLRCFDDLRILGYAVGHSTWLKEVFSTRSNYKLLSPKTAKRLRQVAQPWLNIYLPAFEVFLDQKFNEGMRE